ncbi:MAG: peptidoglycan DD-metalloendopeptidase family protein [Bacteroidota bacterium]
MQNQRIASLRKTYDQWLRNTDWDLVSPINLDGLKAVPVRLDLPHIVPAAGSDEVEMDWLHKELKRQCELQGGQYGYGGYLERRTVYSAANYESVEEGRIRRRNLHLGFDLWTFEAGVPVFAPLAGRVHSLQDNDLLRDYGPTIILEHNPVAGLVFYTLYGHLSCESLVFRPGQIIEAGAIIGEVGELSVNGGWVPHLHFQVILDIDNRVGDFPGVGFADERDWWAKCCPDPARYFGVTLI